MPEDRSHLRKLIAELRGEADRVRALLGLRGERWAEKHRVAAELQRLEAKADELEAELEALSPG